MLLYGAKKEGSGWAEADDDLPPGPVPYDGPIITEALTLFFSAPRPVASAIARALRQVCCHYRSISVQLLWIAAAAAASALTPPLPSRPSTTAWLSWKERRRRRKVRAGRHARATRQSRRFPPFAICSRVHVFVSVVVSHPSRWRRRLVSSAASQIAPGKSQCVLVTQISTRLIPTETLLKTVLHASVCIIAFPCIDQSHATPPRSAGTSEAISKRVTRWKENRAAGQLQVSHESLLTLSAIACDAICHRNGTK